MVREYELMYIVRPELDEEGLQGAVDSVAKLIEHNRGEILKTTMWGKRRLAYEVKHLRDGYYVILRLRMEGTAVAPVERALRIHDTVFRHLLVAKDPGLADDDDLDAEGEGAPAVAAPRAAAETETEAETDVTTEDELEPVAAGVDDDEE